MEDFIGIVRGRTVNSTRGRRPAAQAEQKGKHPEKSGGGRKPVAGRATGKAAGKTTGKPAGRAAGGARRGGGGSKGGGGKRGKPRR